MVRSDGGAPPAPRGGWPAGWRDEDCGEEGDFARGPDKNGELVAVTWGTRRHLAARGHHDEMRLLRPEAPLALLADEATRDEADRGRGRRRHNRRGFLAPPVGDLDELVLVVDEDRGTVWTMFGVARER